MYDLIIKGHSTDTLSRSDGAAVKLEPHLHSNTRILGSIPAEQQEGKYFYWPKAKDPKLRGPSLILRARKLSESPCTCECMFMCVYVYVKTCVCVVCKCVYVVVCVGEKSTVEFQTKDWKLDLTWEVRLKDSTLNRSHWDSFVWTHKSSDGGWSGFKKARNSMQRKKPLVAARLGGQSNKHLYSFLDVISFFDWSCSARHPFVNEYQYQ